MMILKPTHLASKIRIHNQCSEVDLFLSSPRKIRLELFPSESVEGLIMWFVCIFSFFQADIYEKKD